MFPSRSGNPQKGSVLILVVWTVSGLALLAVGLGARALFAAQFTQQMERRLDARYAAVAGVQRVLEILQHDPDPMVDAMSDPWGNSPEILSQQPVGAGNFTVLTGEAHGAVDEESKLPLNVASAEMLRAFFSQAPVLEEAVDLDILIDSILDWRDEDKDKQPNGAENFYYLGLDDPYECKDGPFENLEELLLVRGMTRELFEWAAPHLTVHSSGRVNLNTADAVVLGSLGLSAAGVQGVVFYRAGEDNIPRTPDDRTFPSVKALAAELATLCPNEDLNRLAQLDAKGMLSVNSSVFEFDVTGQVNSDPKSQVRIHCVMDRDGQIKQWEEN